MMTLSY